MKDPNRPFVCTLLILLGLLFITIPIMIPAFKDDIISGLDQTDQIPEYAYSVYHLLWLAAYLIGTSTGVIFIGYGAIRVIRMLRKDTDRVRLD